MENCDADQSFCCCFLDRRCLGLQLTMRDVRGVNLCPLLYPVQVTKNKYALSSFISQSCFQGTCPSFPLSNKKKHRLSYTGSFDIPESPPSLSVSRIYKMNSNELFRLKLTEIASKIEKEKLERLKFLCKDFIPDGDRENISSPVQLLTELEHRRKLAPNHLQFLRKCLEQVGRDDLAYEMETFEREQEELKGKEMICLNSRMHAMPNAYCTNDYWTTSKGLVV